MITWTRNGRKFSIYVDKADEFFHNVTLPRFQKFSIKAAVPSGYVIKMRLSPGNANVLESQLISMWQNKK